MSFFSLVRESSVASLLSFELILKFLRGASCEPLASPKDCFLGLFFPEEVYSFLLALRRTDTVSHSESKNWCGLPLFSASTFSQATRFEGGCLLKRDFFGLFDCF